MAVKGNFKDISFIELLQLMHVARKTGRLEITYENKWAMVIFNEGIVWHVEPRGFRGASSDEILMMLIACKEANFTFQKVQVLPSLERTVNTSTENLILEGTRRLDESVLVNEAVEGEPQSTTNQLAHLLKFKPGSESKVRYVPQNVKRILQLIDGNRNISDVITESQIDATQAAQIIKDLINQEVVESIAPDSEMPAAPAA